MNFIEAALALLSEAGSPLSAEELCERALAGDLLSSPGKVPLRSMKARLTTELKRGQESRVVSLAEGLWGLAGNGAGPAAVEAVEAVEAQPAAQAAPAFEVDGESSPAEIGAPHSDDADHADAAAAQSGFNGQVDGGLEAISPSAEDSEPPPDTDQGQGQLAAVALAALGADLDQLSEEERGLLELYAPDLSPTGPTAANAEYRDEQSADEDRPLRPEIRPHRDRPGRNRGSRRRDGRERNGVRRGREGAVESQPPDYVSAVLHVLVGRDDRRGIPAKQLVELLKGRRLVRGAPANTERAVRAALASDAQARRARGLRSRVSLRPDGRVALATAGLGRSVTMAEEALETALRELEAATREALHERLQRASLEVLERTVTVYLQRIGWIGLEWIKRAGRSAYARGTPPGVEEGGVWLVGARLGGEPIDRRGVGELRAGVEANGLDAGLLISPATLSDAASDMLATEGPPTSLLIGRSLAHAMAAAGVGVMAAAAPALYIDTEFWSEVGVE